MVCHTVLERFVAESPLCVMARATMERVFAADKLDALFQEVADRQYTRELLFSTTVDLMSLVVCRVHPSMHAAYEKYQDQIPVTVQSLYNKLNHVEPQTARELVVHTAREVRELLRHMNGTRRPLLPGYRVRILDGNHLSGTEHRLEVLRHTGAGALPGLALVVLDPQAMVLADVFPCEDAHRQECTLLGAVLETVQPRDVWIDDRHFCTSPFLFGLARRQAFFITRQHAGHLVWRRQGRCRYVGRCPTGRVFEQRVLLTDPETGAALVGRRITVKLAKATRDGDTEIHLLTNLPADDADAVTIAALYRRRWTLETAFQELTLHLKCELNTLGYPAAALFGFCVAAACYNLLAAVKGALRAVHGEDEVQQKLSNFYLTEEISSTYRGMLIAVPPEEWLPFQTLTTAQLARTLCRWAKQVSLSRYRKHVRGPKKPAPRRRSASRQHAATARLLQNRRVAATPRP